MRRICVCALLVENSCKMAGAEGKEPWVNRKGKEDKKRKNNTGIDAEAKQE